MNSIYTKTLTEDSRQQSIQKSKGGDKYAPSNQGLGRNRYERRLHQKVSTSVAQYNKLNMNKLFSDDILDINISVKGETDDYLVRISFSGILANIKKFLNGEIKPLDTKIIMRSLVSAFNSENVFFRCNCADFKYRHAYWASRNNLIAGDPETRPSDVTNANDTKGGCCKHISMVLTNNSWLLKVAAVIRNYTKYMENHYSDLYQRIIYPALYDVSYEEPQPDEQEVVNDETDIDLSLPSEEQDIADINAQAADKRDEKGRFISGNKYQAKPSSQKINNDDELSIGNTDNSNKFFDFDSEY